MNDFGIAQNNFSFKKTLFYTGTIIVVVVGSMFLYVYNKETTPSVGQEDTNTDEYKDAYLKSLMQNNPEPLQDLFLEDIKNGTNSADTKSAAYFVTHRYFDNGGNIYELYGYINSHSELSFLKEAERYYPETFEKIRNHELQETYNGPAMHAYLAYLAVLGKYGYADIAARGTAANQYAKLAFLIKIDPKQFERRELYDENFNITQYYDNEVARSLYAAEKAKIDVIEFFEKGLIPEVSHRDLVVGLNQYASALRYYKYLGISFESPKNAREIFNLSTKYSKSFVPELAIFTGFLNASTLLLDDTSTNDEIREALSSILVTNASNRMSIKNGGIIDKIISAKLEIDAYYPGTNILDINYDLYGKRNIVSLAKRVPEFKTWLMGYGWVESDFEIDTLF